MNHYIENVLFILIALAFSSIVVAKELKPFTSDGCSSFPDGTIKQNKLWLACCIEHDKSYWKGGTRSERLKADNMLKFCVEKTGEKWIAKLMLAGVRVGGSAYWPTNFRWGYGWDFERKYQKLTQEELVEASVLLEKYYKHKKLTSEIK